MAARRWIAVASALALLVGGAASTAQAKGKQKYRFSFKQTMSATWEWPPNPFNHDKRDTGGYTLLSGKGCGTKPSHAIWTITHNVAEGLPVSKLKIDFVHGQQNPAKVVDSNYGGTPAADVQMFLKFPDARTGNVTLSAEPHGEVALLTITPPTAQIKAKKTKKC
jgi:hypothetical protein